MKRTIFRKNGKCIDVIVSDNGDITHKRCPHCKKILLLDKFYDLKIGFAGKRSKCKKCEYEKQKEWNKIKPRERVESSKIYYEKNKEKILKRDKKYRDNNKEKISELRKKRYKANREKIRNAQKKYYEKNKKEILKRNYTHNKKRYHIDIDFNIRRRLSSQLRINLKSNNIKNKGTFYKLTGFTSYDYIEHFKKYQLNEFKKMSETKNHYHIDHIIPCKIYDLTKIEDIKKCWNPRNLRIIPALENTLKKDSIDYNLIKKYNIYDLLPEKLQSVAI